MAERLSMLLRAVWVGGKGITMIDSEIPVMEAILVGAPDPEIVAVEARLRSAQLNADPDALDQLIDDDLLFTGPDGNLATKADDISAHRSGLVRFRKHEPEELRIRRVGADVAIATLRANLTVEIAGSVSSGTYRYTRVWAREVGGSWRVVGGHVSSLVIT
jgi:ketosteroid isomerase-like protein